MKRRRVISQCARWLAAGFLIAAPLVGCGSDRPNLTPVTGTVTHGGQPLASANVTFYPETGVASSGVTGPDGRFELQWNDGSKGAIPGKHKVHILRPGPEAPAPEGGDTPPPPAGPPPVEYHTEAEVKADGANDITLDVPR